MDGLVGVGLPDNVADTDDFSADDFERGFDDEEEEDDLAGSGADADLATPAALPENVCRNIHSKVNS